MLNSTSPVRREQVLEFIDLACAGHCWIEFASAITLAFDFLDHGGLGVTPLPDPERIRPFLGLFHKTGERFFVSWRGSGETEITHHEPFERLRLSRRQSGWPGCRVRRVLHARTFEPGSTRRLKTVVNAPNSLWLDLDKDPYGSLRLACDLRPPAHGALIAKWGWSEHAAKSGGVVAGLEEGQLFATPPESSQKEKQLPKGNRRSGSWTTRQGRTRPTRR